MAIIHKLNPELFDWVTWRNGSPIDIIGCPVRESNMETTKPRLLKYAVGYCDAASLLCRPKPGHKAVMFFKDGTAYWFHLRDSEFNFVFNA